jgi:hypothetical protein
MIGRFCRGIRVSLIEPRQLSWMIEKKNDATCDFEMKFSARCKEMAKSKNLSIAN